MDLDFGLKLMLASVIFDMVLKQMLEVEQTLELTLGLSTTTRCVILKHRGGYSQGLGFESLHKVSQSDPASDFNTCKTGSTFLLP